MYEYRGRCVKVVDGDTMDVVLDLGFNIEKKVRLRLHDLDTFEMRDKDLRLRAVASKEKVALMSLVPSTKELIVKTYKTDKYGRYVADVYFWTDAGRVWVNEEMRQLHKEISNGPMVTSVGTLGGQCLCGRCSACKNLDDALGNLFGDPHIDLLR